MTDSLHATQGSLIGTAVGDSIGLPYEGLKPRRAQKFIGKELKQNLIYGKGMFSDDTEHTCMVVQSLISCYDNLDCFSKIFSWKLRFWLLGLPAGIGLGTLKAIIKLWLGFPPTKSGVNSAGNGPAMRSSIIGVFFKDDYEKMKQFVHASTIITHSDPKAYYSALTVALAAAIASKQEDISPLTFVEQLIGLIPDLPKDYLEILNGVCSSMENKDSLQDYLTKNEQREGITGYSYFTVPAVIHCWLRHQTNYKCAITEIIQCGGDTDTTAAILGGIVGAREGIDGIPEIWVSSIIEYPRTTAWIKRLGKRLNDVHLSMSADKALNISVLFILLRNVSFIILVLLVGLRRLLPPY